MQAPHNHTCCNDCSDCSVEVVCRCLQVTEAVLLRALETLEVHSLKDLRRATGAGEGCTCCHPRLEKYLHRHSLVMAEEG